MIEGVHIETIYGVAPVQAEGTVDGKPFYFRSRGNRWSMRIGGRDVVGHPEWTYTEAYGDEPFDASYITVEEAQTFIEKAVDCYRAGMGRTGLPPR